MLRSLPEDHSTLAIGTYILRARQERELAARASTSHAAHTHLKLAQHYETLVSLVDSDGADREGAGSHANPALQPCFGFRANGASGSPFGSRSHY